ncbi:MAG TPA: hypothetical protein VF796_12785 [Humisphaera sp.]
MKSRPPLLLVATFLPALLLAGGCGSVVDNPSFPLSIGHAAEELDAMAAAPKPLDRPVVVVSGYLDPGIGSYFAARNLRRATGARDDQVIWISLFWCGDFEACRERIIKAVDEAFPSADPHWTTEVDVVGHSMGGLAARYAALPPGALSLPTAAGPTTAPAAYASDVGPAAESPDTRPAEVPIAGRALRIHRLYTLSTPHQGAVLADVPTLVSTQRSMRRGSDFIAKLNAAEPPHPFEVVAYTRVPDNIVGAEYAAPPGRTPIWVSAGLLESAHGGIVLDPRVVADLARRLRGETPYATEPQAPLPN